LCKTNFCHQASTFGRSARSHRRTTIFIPAIEKRPNGSFMCFK
jgi:hypothetical protein